MARARAQSTRKAQAGGQAPAASGKAVSRRWASMAAVNSVAATTAVPAGESASIARAVRKRSCHARAQAPPAKPSTTPPAREAG